MTSLGGIWSLKFEFLNAINNVIRTCYKDDFTWSIQQQILSSYLLAVGVLSSLFSLLRETIGFYSDNWWLLTVMIFVAVVIYIVTDKFGGWSNYVTWTTIKEAVLISNFIDLVARSFFVYILCGWFKRNIDLLLWFPLLKLDRRDGK